MKNWKVFIVLGFVALMIFGWIHFEYAKTAWAFDLWFGIGVGLFVLFMIIGIVGYAGQGKKQ